MTAVHQDFSSNIAGRICSLGWLPRYLSTSLEFLTYHCYRQAAVSNPVHKAEIPDGAGNLFWFHETSRTTSSPFSPGSSCALVPINIAMEAQGQTDRHLCCWISLTLLPSDDCLLEESLTIVFQGPPTQGLQLSQRHQQVMTVLSMKEGSGLRTGDRK